MAINGGVQITGFLSPTASGDTYATHDALYGRDGLRNVDLLTDLDNIDDDRRRAGMIVGVGGYSGFASHYTLMPEGTGWTHTVTDWSLAFLTPSATTASDIYTTGATLFGEVVYFDRNDTLSAYTANLSAFTSEIESPYKYTTGIVTAIEPRLGGNVINNISGGNEYSNIGGGTGNTIDNIGSNPITFNKHNNIGGGQDNHIAIGGNSAIGGGNGNVMSAATNSTIGGGYSNYIKAAEYGNKGGSFYGGSGVIAGGQDNIIGNVIETTTGGTFNYTTGQATIAGGNGNEIRSNNYWYGNTIGGGDYNKILAPVMKPVGGAEYTTYCGGNTIGGGKNNITYSYNSTIGGGYENKIHRSGWFGGNIAGGALNTIGDQTHVYAYTAGKSTIGGGFGNHIGQYTPIVIGDPFLMGPKSYNSFIGGGGKNRTDMWGTNYATIGGGNTNSILGINENAWGYTEAVPRTDNSVISGGFGNQILSGHSLSVIGGGRLNRIGLNMDPVVALDPISNTTGSNVIGGGGGNSIFNLGIGTGATAEGVVTYTTIGGGKQNRIGTTELTPGGFYLGFGRKSHRSTIGGGYENIILNSTNSTIGGGMENNISDVSQVISTPISLGANNTISGGFGNQILSRTYSVPVLSGNYDSFNSIVGGSENIILGNSSYNFVGGGMQNTITGSSWTTIGGGANNLITSGATHSSVAGGSANTVTHAHSHIVGSNITSVSAHTTHVERLNVGTITTGSSATQVLVRESNGMVNSTTISSFTQQKYAASVPFTAATSQTITHNLGDTDVLVQLKDSSGILIIPDVVDTYTTNSVDIQVSSTETYRVIIIG